MQLIFHESHTSHLMPDIAFINMAYYLLQLSYCRYANRFIRHTGFTSKTDFDRDKMTVPFSHCSMKVSHYTTMFSHCSMKVSHYTTMFSHCSMKVSHYTTMFSLQWNLIGRNALTSAHIPMTTQLPLSLGLRPYCRERSSIKREVRTIHTYTLDWMWNPNLCLYIYLAICMQSRMLDRGNFNAFIRK